MTKNAIFSHIIFAKFRGSNTYNSPLIGFQFLKTRAIEIRLLSRHNPLLFMTANLSRNSCPTSEFLHGLCPNRHSVASCKFENRNQTFFANYIKLVSNAYHFRLFLLYFLKKSFIYTILLGLIMTYKKMEN